MHRCIGANLLNQDLPIITVNAYVFPPFLLIGPLLRSLRSQRATVTFMAPKLSPPPGPVVALEVYIEMCDYLKVDVRRGYLFRPISPSGDILPGPCDSSAAQARLISYAKKIPDAFKGRHPTLHGLRSGCEISLALYEIKLREIMDHVGWKANATAYHYTKLRQVLGPWWGWRHFIKTSK